MNKPLPQVRKDSDENKYIITITNATTGEVVTKSPLVGEYVMLFSSHEGEHGDIKSGFTYRGRDYAHLTRMVVALTSYIHQDYCDKIVAAYEADKETPASNE